MHPVIRAQVDKRTTPHVAMTRVEPEDVKRNMILSFQPPDLGPW